MQELSSGAPGNIATGSMTTISLDGGSAGKRFDGIGIVNGGGATSVLLKDYPEPQRSQILDLVFKPHFGASVSALLVEIPGDGNATQGAMPSHMHTREDRNFLRGYTWWILREAKKRNPHLTLDATAWSVPGWVGQDPATRVPGQHGDAAFWSRDAADYYVQWLKGLRAVHGLELDALGCRNEKGYSLEFAKILRRALNENGFQDVLLHAFDHWPEHKFHFVESLLEDAEARDAIDILGAHTLNSRAAKGIAASARVQQLANEMGKPIWNTEEHIYQRGFACALSIVESFNDNFITSGATKVVNWYDIAGVYPLEPYAEDPAMILAHSPWSGHYVVREALWGYAHYGQFTRVGWRYMPEGCLDLPGGGSVVCLRAPEDSQADYSVIFQTKGADCTQELCLKIGPGLSTAPLCVWRSDARQQFVRLEDISPVAGQFCLRLEPDSLYSLSTTRGQQKGGFADIPQPAPFPLPYRDTMGHYSRPADHGYLPRFTADIAGAFEITECPDGSGQCLRQVVPVPTLSWAPDWRPYSILGDADWADYEVSVWVWLHPGDAAAVMGRVNHVGTGYGFVPRCYYLQVDGSGDCRLVVSRGKENPHQLTGDAEQQALIRALQNPAEGGEKVLESKVLPGLAAGRWHHLRLELRHHLITAFVDGQQVLQAEDALYSHGMAGILAGQEQDRVSTPYYRDFQLAPLQPGTGTAWEPALAAPLYPGREP